MPAVKFIRFNGTSQWLLPNVYRVSAAQWRYRDFPSLPKGLPCPYLVSLHLSPAPGSHRQGEQLIHTVTPCMLAISFFHSTQGRRGPSWTSRTQEAGVAGRGWGAPRPGPGWRASPCIQGGCAGQPFQCHLSWLKSTLTGVPSRLPAAGLCLLLRLLRCRCSLRFLVTVAVFIVALR